MMDSDKTGLNQTEFHREKTDSLRPVGSVRLENAVSDIKMKLGMLDQINLKLTSLKKDITEIYTKIDVLEDAGLLDGKADSRSSKNKAHEKPDPGSFEMKEIRETVAAIDEKLILLQDIRERVCLLQESELSKEKLKEQLEAPLAEIEDAGKELEDIQEITDKLKGLSSFEEKLPVLDEISVRLKKLDQFVNLKTVLETIGEKLKKIDSVDRKVSNVDEKLNEVNEKLTSISRIYDKLQAIDQIDEKLGALDAINQKLAKLEAMNLGLQAGALIKQSIPSAKVSAANKPTVKKAVEEDTIPEGINDEFEEDYIPEGIDDEFEEDVIPQGIDDEFEEDYIPEGIDDEFEEEISEREAKVSTGFFIAGDLADEDKSLLEEINEKLQKLEEIDAKLVILEEFGERLEMFEDMDEQINYIRDFLEDKLDLDYVAMYETLREEVHEDAIKTYRNIQAVIVEENAKQNHVLFGVDGNQDKLKFRMNHVMIFSIVSFVTSILVMLLQILPALGIDLF